MAWPNSFSIDDKILLVSLVATFLSSCDLLSWWSWSYTATYFILNLFNSFKYKGIFPFDPQSIIVLPCLNTPSCLANTGITILSVAPSTKITFSEKNNSLLSGLIQYDKFQLSCSSPLNKSSSHWVILLPVCSSSFFTI